MARKRAMKWNDLNLNQRSSRLQMTMWSLIEEMNRDSSDNQLNQKNPYSKKQEEMNRDSSDSSDNQINQKNPYSENHEEMIRDSSDNQINLKNPYSEK